MRRFSDRDFAMRVVRWQKKHGRHDLPWQQPQEPGQPQQGYDPYKIWLSEIMLQQTQVAAVIPYYQRFLRRFPALPTLARAKVSSVLAVWSGLGYYARARHLHAAAVQMHKNGIPQTAAEWEALPGVGRSTAAAIAVFAYNERCAILDGNVKRIFARAHMLPAPVNTPAAQKPLWALAAAHLPPARYIRAYTQGLMDLGALCCTRAKPRCEQCPLQTHCLAYQQGVVSDYPARAAKKRKPEKRAHFVLLCAGGSVLLRQRPARGIWGGLWAPPLQEDAGWRHAGGKNMKKTAALNFTHEFTHYRLLTDVTVYCAGGKLPKPDKPLRWHSRSALAGIALPAPIKTLLTRL